MVRSFSDVTSLFQHIGLLPIAYFLVVMCVVCCGIVAKTLGNSLIQAVPKPIGQLLAKSIGPQFTGDTILDSLFEAQLLENIRQRLLPLNLKVRAAKSRVVPIDRKGSLLNCLESVFAGKYWSGCPPKLA
jgi:hypothetical protein